MSQRGQYYLMLPATETLRWSKGCDAIEDAAGRTVALFEELEAILGGVFATPPVPAFLDVLRIFHSLRSDTPHSDRYAPLRVAYRRNQKAESVSRHLGLLIAELCRSQPPALNSPDFGELQLALYRLWSDGQKHRPEYAVMPAHAEAEFAEIIASKIREFDAAALDHFLKFGTAPTDAGEKLADEIDDLPGTVERVLALARTRPRLVGAALLSPVLDAAMTLPARSRSSEALPLGGYADVTTRGDPDRLLLSQFALDPDDFVRRFAERELLYFKREEPHAPIPPERVIVLDQGVRTWGGVRLALAAAALALLKQVPAKAPVPRLFPTSRGNAVPIPPQLIEDLAKALEASDLTKHPGELLATVCDEPDCLTPRDILLLTHPRSAAEPEVIAAARERRPTDRLFVLAVNDDGAAQLSEWTARGPISVRSFRVDLIAAENAEPAKGPTEAVPAGPSVEYRPWTGSVEPVPFPFRPGLLDQPELMGFDAAGEWLVIVARGGIPHAVTEKGDRLEVLPRAMINGVILKQVNAILPVTGGVVICGTMMLGNQYLEDVPAATSITMTTGKMVAEASATIPSLESQSASSHFHVAAHYDLTTRTLRLFVFDPCAGQAVWEAHPDLHCVVLRSGAGRCPLALDLSSAKLSYPFEWTGRTRQARARTMNLAAGPKTVQILTDIATLKKVEPFLNFVGNSLRIYADSQWELFEPTEDDKPLLAGAIVSAAQLAGTVLAMAITKGSETELRLYRGPDPTALGVVPLHGNPKLFTLSHDGSKLAWLRSKREVALAETDRLPHVVEKFAHAALHGQFEVECKAAPFLLEIRVGSYQHSIGIGIEGLWYGFSTKKNAQTGRMPQSASLPNRYGSTRFQVIAGTEQSTYRVIFDRFGQLLLLNSTNDLLVAFLVRRDKIAAWTPAGGFWGSPDLIGGAPTPGADKAIALAIRPDWRSP